MSDSPWQSPGGPPPGESPTFAAPGPPTASFPAGSFPAASFPTAPPPLAPGAWAPPPKPGLVPLRPLGLGDILGGSFKVLRRNPRPVIGVSMAIKLVVAIITIASLGLFTVLGLSVAFNSGDPTFSRIGLGDQVQSLAGSLVTFILGIVADALLQGIITLEVARGTLGEKLPLRSLWRLARGRLLPLVGWSAAVGGVLLLSFLLYFGGLVAILVSGGAGAIPGALFVGFLVGVGALVLGCWIGVRLSLVPSALLLERVKLREAMSRSWLLTRGFFWRTFGIEVLVALIVGAAAGIILFPIDLIITIITLSTSTSVTGTTVVPHISFANTVISEIAKAIVGAITAIIATASTALIYIDLRIRKEGLDLELLRFVESKDSGVESPDPYLSRTTVPNPFQDASSPTQAFPSNQGFPTGQGFPTNQPPPAPPYSQSPPPPPPPPGPSSGQPWA